MPNFRIFPVTGEKSKIQIVHYVKLHLQDGGNFPLSVFANVSKTKYFEWYNFSHKETTYLNVFVDNDHIKI